MKIKDHFLSQEEFEIKPSNHKDILETFPKPSMEKLVDYYDSPDYISHQTKARTFRDKIYQGVKSIMINRKKRLIMGYKREGSILDVGAGTGEFLEAFEERNWNKTVLEPSAKFQSVYKEKKFSALKDLSQANENSFDVITLWHSLEHIPQLEDTVKELKRILKPNGVIFIAVPNYKSYDSKFYKEYWAAWDVPRHLWHFSRNGLKELFIKENFICPKEIGLPFDAYYVSLLSEKYKPRGYNLRAFVIGALSNLKSSLNQEYSSIIYVLRHNKAN